MDTTENQREGLSKVGDLYLKNKNKLNILTVSLLYIFFQTEISFGKDIADGSWHFVVFTVDTDSNTVQFYLDGTAVGSPR